MDICELRANSRCSSNRHPWERARLTIAAELIKANLKSPPQLILDIGCGDGYVLSGLQESFENCSCFGVDLALDNKLISEMREQFESQRKPIFLYNNLQDAISSIDSAPSVVLLMDVLEHVERDIDFLRNLLNSIPFDGSTLFLITVPAFMKLFSAHDILLKHFRRYNKSELERCAASAGLAIVDSGYFFFSLLAARWLQMAWKRLCNPPAPSSVGVSSWKHGNHLTNFVIFMLLFEFHISRRFKGSGILLPGLSAYALCRPQL